MRRLLLALLTILALAALAPAAAQAGWYAADPVDGPSADIVAVDDLDVSRDGTGALVWRRRVDGAPHVFLSRLAGGAWLPPERVDATIPEGAEEVSVGVADGGRLAVFWVSGARVFGAYAAAGAGPQPLSAPVLLHASGDGAPSGGLDAEMGINGTAFAVWRASGAGGADVRAARLRGGEFALLPAPLDIAPTNSAGGGTGRPRVAVDAAGIGVATWSEAGRLWARRLLGLELSRFPQEASMPELGGGADMPEIDVEEDGSFAWIAFRQFDASGSRAVARRLVGLTFDPGAVIDPGPGVGPPAVSINGRGSGTALVPAGGGSVLVADIAPNNRFGAPVRLDGQGGAAEAEVALAMSDARGVAAVWRRDAGNGNSAVIGRFRALGADWEPEVELSRPELGPVAPGSLHASGNESGDTAVAMLQGTGAGQRVVAAVYDLPPGRAFPHPGWVREAQPLLRWSGGADLWGLQGFQVILDGVALGGLMAATSVQAPAPLPDGNHTLQVITVDRRGQATPSKVRTVRVDTVPPTAAVRVTGKRRKGRKLRVTVAAADAGSGVAAVSVNYGDRKRRAREAVFDYGRRIKPGRQAVTRFAYKRRGRYRLVASVTDAAGHVATVTLPLRIRR
jgi:hypothetical protein